MTAVPQPPAEQRGDVAAWLDRLDRDVERVTGTLNYIGADDYERLIAAIRGVVHEHQRIEPPHQDAGFCLGCDVSWPCPTYRAVAAALTDGTPR